MYVCDKMYAGKRYGQKKKNKLYTNSIHTSFMHPVSVTQNEKLQLTCCWLTQSVFACEISQKHQKFIDAIT